MRFLIKIAKRIKSVLFSSILLMMNILKALRLNPIRAREIGGVRYQGASRNSLGDCYVIHSSLNNNHNFNWSRRALYWLFSNKLVFCAVQNGRVVAVAFFVFNIRDFKEDSVHSSFSGVLAEYQGQGIAKEIRKTALLHFASCGLGYYSSRISLDNKASLHASLNIGFQVSEKYYDPVSKEERYYLKCDLEKYRE